MQNIKVFEVELAQLPADSSMPRSQALEYLFMGGLKWGGGGGAKVRNQGI